MIFSLSKVIPILNSIRKICIDMPILIAITFLLIIPGAVILISANSYFATTTTNLAYGQPNQTISSAINSLNTQSIPLEKVHVGDIDIAYKTLGKGDPFLLISGSSATMDAWEPSTIRDLSSNHTVIIFDNRGVGNTTTGNKTFSIQQLVNDTAGLLDALQIQKADVLGYSLGSFVAQQLSVTHPEKVNRLVLLAASCGGKENIPENPQLVKFFSEMVNKSINNISITPQEVKMVLSIPMGSSWLELHPNFLESVPEAKDLFAGIPPNTIKQQNDISQNWMATNWSGICNDLTKISNPTLIITGTNDNNIPSANSLIITEKIPGAWLIQIKDAGHALFVQYPDKVNKILQTFLSATTTSLN